MDDLDTTVKERTTEKKINQLSEIEPGDEDLSLEVKIL